jgi:hypothetical protein
MEDDLNISKKDDQNNFKNQRLSLFGKIAKWGGNLKVRLTFFA